jgi:hypothetical protein
MSQVKLTYWYKRALEDKQDISKRKRVKALIHKLKKEKRKCKLQKPQLVSIRPNSTRNFIFISPLLWWFFKRKMQ